LIDKSVSDGRLAPKARGAFDDLFGSTGLKATKAALNALPPKSLINPGPAPVPEPDDELTATERAKADKMDDKQREKFTALRLANRAKKGTN